MKISSAVKVVAVSALVLFGLTLSSCKACDKNEDKNKKDKYESKVCMPGNVDVAVDIANGDVDAAVDTANGDDFAAAPQAPVHIAPATVIVRLFPLKVYDAIDNLKNKTNALTDKINALNHLKSATGASLIWRGIAGGSIIEAMRTVKMANYGVLVAEARIKKGYWQHAWDRDDVVRRSKESKEKMDVCLMNASGLRDEIKENALCVADENIVNVCVEISMAEYEVYQALYDVYQALANME
jgi:hypothetical protein